MPYAESKHPTMRDTAPTDTRRWRIVSDYLGNDPQPYTTAQLFEYAAQCNQEHAADPEWGTPFQLVDGGDKIIDVSHECGNDGYLAAVLRNTNRRRDKDMVTPDRIMTWNPCEDYPRRRVEQIIGEHKTSLECLDLDIPPEDRLWLVLRPDVIPARELRLLACSFALEVLPLFEAQYPDDRRPRAAIEAAQGFARGNATALERASWAAAMAAATAASWAAAMAAATAASRAADLDAANAAARAAASAATWAARAAASAAANAAASAATWAARAAASDASWDAARAAARRSQIDITRRVMSEL